MQPSHDKVNILIVDDRIENLISLAAVLDSPQYNLIKATSGRQALKCVLDQEFALILMDVQMPTMDGFEAATLIRQRENSKDIPIIFISAISKGESFLFKGYSAGAVDYVYKPFEPVVLRSKVAVFAELFQKNLKIRQQEELLREAERKRAEFKLKQSEGLTAAIIDSALDCIVSMDQEGKILEFNPAAERTFGYRREDAVGRLMADLLVPARFREQVIPGKSDLIGQRVEMTGMRSDGREFPAEIAITRVPIEGPPVFTSHLRDITERKKAEEDLKIAVTARDEFLSIASHELKTPLTSIDLHMAGILRTLRMGKAHELTPEKLESKIASAYGQVKRLTMLINTLLDVTRITSGRMPLTPQSVDLTDVVYGVSGRFEEDLKNSGSQFTIKNGGQNGSRIVGLWDPLRVETVVSNLLSNAIKYGEGKPIEIVIDKHGDRGRLKVTDHGIGIAPDAQQRIFQRFERAVPEAHYGGFGIGLWIACQAVEAHGGTIDVASRKGEGSTFTVELPLQKN